MPASRAACRRVVSTAILAVVPITSGCGVINAGLGLLGLGGDPTPAGSPAAPLEGGSAPDGAAAIYEHGPTPAWQQRTQGRPSVPVYGFLAGATPFSCTLAPSGAFRVLPIPGEVPMTPLHRWGPVQLGVAGTAWQNVLDLGRDHGGATATLLEGASRLGTEGEGCRFTAFLYVSIGPSTSQPVSVLRE